MCSTHTLSKRRSLYTVLNFWLQSIIFIHFSSDMPPKIFKPPEALNALLSTYTYSEDVVQPLNGHVIQLYVANDYNRRETARDILKKFRCEADELAVLNRLSTLIGRLIYLRKSLSRNEVQIKSLLELEFDIQTPSKPQKRPLHDPSNTPGPSAPKILKTDCDKCPSLRERLSQLAEELREEKKRCRDKISDTKISYNVKAVNRSKRQTEHTKTKLRMDVAVLKKENSRLKKEVESLKDNIDGLPKLTARLQRQSQAAHNRNQFLKEQIATLKKTIHVLEQDIKALNVDNDHLLCQLEEDEEESVIETKCGSVYVPELRQCIYKSLDCQTPVDKASDLIQFIGKTLFQKTLSPMPCPTTTAQAAFELGVLSDLQVAQTLYEAETATIGWDATQTGGDHWNEIHISVRNKDDTFTEQTLDVAEIAGGCTGDYVESITNALQDIASRFSLYTGVHQHMVLYRYYFIQYLLCNIY